jgi:hypothetical protein
MLSSSNAETPQLAQTEKRMKSILHNRKIKTSRRKALYDQELGRYLRQRKEKIEKPVKVELVNKGGAKVMLEPKVGDSNKKIIAPVEEDARKGTMEEPPEIEDELPALPHDMSAPPHDTVEQGRARQSTRLAARTKITTRKAKRATQLITLVKHKVWANRAALGITEKGAVLNSANEPIKGSNYISIIRYALASSTAGKVLPKGSRDLLARIKRDTELNEIFQSAYKVQRGTGAFAPATWS